MAETALDLKCPGCGAGVTTDQKVCAFCGRPVVVCSFNDVYTMSLADVQTYAGSYESQNALFSNGGSLRHSLGMCYLKLRLYDKAVAAFSEAIERRLNNSELYFFAAVALLRGKKAFVADRKTIDTALEYVNAALALESRGIYYYFLAYLKYDYFERKFLNTTPDYKACLQAAADRGVSDFDKQMLFDVLSVTNPFS